MRGNSKTILANSAVFWTTGPAFSLTLSLTLVQQIRSSAFGLLAAPGIHMGPAGSDYDGIGWYRGFLNVEEAKDLVASLSKAIERAETKSGRPHPNRVQ